MCNIILSWYALYRLLQLECCENASISVINRWEPRGRISCLFFKNHLGPTLSILSIPFSSIPSPASLYIDKARTQNLPGNLHTIKATTSARATWWWRSVWRYIAWCKGHFGNSIIWLSTLFSVLFTPFIRNAVNNRDERKVRCMIIQNVQI